jgi:hypothetical protein
VQFYPTTGNVRRSLPLRFSLAAVAFVVLFAAPMVQAICTAPVGDVTANGKLNVADTVCITLVTLFAATGSQGAAPSCLGGGAVLSADFNCDGNVYVSDAQLHVLAVLGDPMDPGIDSDANLCPDACQGPCVGKPDGTACNADSNGCTQDDVCQEGVCTLGTPATCNDGLSCTTDSCISAGDNGFSCSNTLIASRCLIGGACYVGNANNPTNACQACVPATSTSQFTNKVNGTLCNADSNGCTQDDACQAGVCTAGTLKACGDGLACTTDSCTSTGNNSSSCSNTLNANRCLIGGACYQPNVNNPANACQACVPATSTSQFTNKVNGTLCNADSDGCTEDDVCQAGVCTAGPLVTCSDNLGCTADTCTSTGNDTFACTNTLLANRCLVGGVCYLSNNNNPTNACQACVPATSTSQFTNKVNGTLCNADSNGCTQDDACQAGVCTAGALMSCADGLGCTTDACNSTGNNSFSCSNTLIANRCLIGGACYQPNVNNPTNACQSCVPATSTSQFTNKVNGTLCNADSDGCTEDDVCQAGVCTAGPLVTCSDNLGCTADTCTSTGHNTFACVNTLVANRCLVGGVCYVGNNNNPTNPCQSCVPATSTSQFTNKVDGVACNADSNGCTKDDACQAGVCAAGALMTCADGLGCTTDACSSTGNNSFACSNSLNANRCLIGNKCYTPGAENPENNCQVCMPSNDSGAWTSEQPAVWYADTDGDGFGADSDTALLCGALAPYSVLVGGDCNDNNPSVHPDAEELCDNLVDDNCDGQVNEEGCLDACELALGVKCDEFDEAYLKASNTGADDRFGHAVALSGDTLAVGAWSEDSDATGINGKQTNNSAPDSGAVYVFRRTNGVWVQEAYLKASNAGAGDHFGYSLALSGDTLAVGSRWEDSHATGINGDQNNNSAPDSGAVYVFRRTNGAWAQEAYVKASNAGEDDHFGFAVALSGNALAVGAWFEDSGATGINGDQTNNSATNSGAAYVFRRTNGAWAQEAYVKASNTKFGDGFGESIALSGDTLAVGAPFERSNATGVNGNQANFSAWFSGAAYVFRRTNGVWLQEAYVKASNTGAEDNFGDSVALSGDVLAVGAPYESSNATGIDGGQSNNSAPDSGAVYLFLRTNGVWAQEAYVKASNTGASDNFGSALALWGDALAVGATGEDSDATGINGDQTTNLALGSGAVYVFRRTNGAWGEQAYVKASNTGAGDNFGDAVALSGNTLAVGAPAEDSNATGINGDQANNSSQQSGAVYVRKIAP